MKSIKTLEDFSVNEAKFPGDGHSMKEAAALHRMSISCLSLMLNGKRTNKTNLKYLSK